MAFSPALRPNIVLLVADDIPRNMLGAYGAAHNLAPNLDVLARDGLTFDRAYTTAPLCTPSRFSLLTGRYASNASSIPSHRPWNLVGFNTFLTGAEPTIAHHLSHAGYATAFCGKYHLGFPLPEGQVAARAGGSSRTKFGGSGRGLSYDELAAVVRQYGGFEETIAVWGGNKQTAQSPHNPEWMASQAQNFMSQAVSRQPARPFFLFFAGTVPHSPFALPSSFEVNVTRTPAGPVAYVPEWEERRRALLAKLTPHGLICKDYRQCHRLDYAGSTGTKSSVAWKQPLALSEPWLDGDWLYSEANFEQGRLARLFAVGLAWLDDSIGSVLSSLRSLAIDNTTIVVYTADHGASFLGKGHIYEAGVRVPLIFRWPQSMASRLSSSSSGGGGGGGGWRSTSSVALIDLAPTLLAAAGVATELVRSYGLHGRSILPLLQTAAVRVGGDASNGIGSEDNGGGGRGGGGRDERSNGGGSDRSSARPLFFEVGYARAVLRGSWKLVVVNDPIDKCAAPADGSCRNLHGESIDRFQCNFTANGHMGNRLAGACNMTYDAVARHPGFCGRRQLYNLITDPLEQANVVEQQPALYDELLGLIIEHARHVEAANPAVSNRPPGASLRQCDRIPPGSRRG